MSHHPLETGEEYRCGGAGCKTAITRVGSFKKMCATVNMTSMIRREQRSPAHLLGLVFTFLDFSHFYFINIKCLNVSLCPMCVQGQ